MSSETMRQGDYGYIVVGSGAASGDPRELSGGDPNNPDKNDLPEDYDVPVFHGLSTENDAMSRAPDAKSGLLTTV